MLVTFQTLLGTSFEYQYSDVTKRDEWFEKMVRKSGEHLHEKRFLVRENRLIISDLGSFIFENEKEAKSTWIAYLSRIHMDFTGV